MMFLNKKYLKKECVPVNFDNPDKNLLLANEMIAMVRKKKALGLAANQIGKDIRLFVMVFDHKIYRCFNPDILGVSEEKIFMPEGCLSFPGQYLSIDRSRTIKVEYYDAFGNRTEDVIDGIEARCFMHEFDHLNGITMYERFNDVT